MQQLTNTGTIVKELNFSGTLLTEQESECLRAGRQLQRKALIAYSFNGSGFFNALRMTSLSWSRSPWRFVLQLALYWLCLPFVLIGQLLRQSWLWLLFPFRYVGTFFLSDSIQAPGEKTLDGIHHQFSPYLNLKGRDYIQCVNLWVKILYGPEKAKYHNFARYLHQERRRLQDQGINDPAFLAVTYRKQITEARARLSRDLGNY